MPLDCIAILLQGWFIIVITSIACSAARVLVQGRQQRRARKGSVRQDVACQRPVVQRSRLLCLVSASLSSGMFAHKVFTGVKCVLNASWALPRGRVEDADTLAMPGCCADFGTPCSDDYNPCCTTAPGSELNKWAK